MPFDLREEALRGLVAFRDVLDHLITESLTRHNGERPTVETNAFPVDVVEQAGSYILQASLPGVTPEGLSIQTRGNIITIRGQRAVREALPHQQWIQCEQHATTFARAITLPFAIDADLSIASFEHGVLTLELPMTESAKLKTITLGTATPTDLVIEEIIVAEPVAEEIIVEEIVIEEPLALEIIVEEPVIEEVFTEELIVEEPIAEEIIAEEIVAEETITEEIIVAEFLAEEIIAEELMVEFVAEMIAEEAALDEPFTMAYLEEAEMVALAVAILAESEVMEAIAEMDTIVAADIIDLPLATAEGFTSETLEGVILEQSDEFAAEVIAEEVFIVAAIAEEEAIAEEIVIEAAIAEELDAEEIALQEMIAAEAIVEVLADVELHEIHADVVTDAEIIDIRGEIKEVA